MLRAQAPKRPRCLYGDPGSQRTKRPFVGVHVSPGNLAIFNYCTAIPLCHLALLRNSATQTAVSMAGPLVVQMQAPLSGPSVRLIKVVLAGILKAVGSVLVMMEYRLKIERKGCIPKGQCAVGDRSRGPAPARWLGARTDVSPGAEGPLGGGTLRAEPGSGAPEPLSFHTEARRLCLETGL